MVLEEKTLSETGKRFDDIGGHKKVFFRCDYCGSEGQKEKKSLLRGRKYIQKDACSNRECVNKKRREVTNKNYGSENYFSTNDFKKKQIDTNRRKYGVDEYFQSQHAKESRHRTLVQKYGVDSPLKNETIKKKQQATCQLTYGQYNYSKTDTYHQKLKKTNLERYGQEYAIQSEAVKSKRTQTCLKRYGVNSYTQTNEYWEKRKKTCLDKYGVEHPSQTKEVKKKWVDTNKERYGVDYYPQLPKAKKDYEQTCKERFGVPNPLCLSENRKFGKTTQDLSKWLQSHTGYNFQPDYDILKGKELDLYCKDLKVAIEYCGLYWHTEISPTKRDHRYHHNKYTICRENGVKLITIFEDEFKLKKDQVLYLLKASTNIFQNRIGARECDIAIVDKTESNEFLNKYHLLGAPRHSLVGTCLSYQNKPMMVLSLGRHPRKSHVLTLDRLASTANCQIIGGASRLLKQAKSWAVNNDYAEIITWSDNRWSDGGVYEKVGFTLDAELPPDYSYVDMAKPYRRISKQSQKKSSTGCPKDITEREWALSHGLARIWDCGKKRWKLSL